MGERIHIIKLSIISMVILINKQMFLKIKVSPKKKLKNSKHLERKLK